jgi:hypothetical protein
MIEAVRTNSIVVKTDSVRWSFFCRIKKNFKTKSIRCVCDRFQQFFFQSHIQSFHWQMCVKIVKQKSIKACGSSDWFRCIESQMFAQILEQTIGPSMFYDPWENSAAFDMIEIKQHKTRTIFLTRFISTCLLYNHHWLPVSASFRINILTKNFLRIVEFSKNENNCNRYFEEQLMD